MAFSIHLHPALPITLLAASTFACMAPGHRPMDPPSPVLEDPVPAFINPPSVPQLAGFSSAVRVGLTVYLSGQVPLDSAGHLVAEGDLGGQARQVFQNIATIVRAARGVPGDVVKITLYLASVSPKDLAVIREAAGPMISGGHAPALTVVTVAGLPMPGMLLAADGVAVLRAEFPDRQRDLRGH